MKGYQRFFLLVVDVILVLASLLLALVLRFENNIPAKFLEPNVVPYFTLCFFSAGVLWLFGLYNRLWRYASVEEGINLFNALTVSFGLFAIPVFVTHGAFYPRGVAVIAWILALFLLGGVRLLLRLATFKIIAPHGKRKVLIVGGGDAGEAVVRELKREHSLYWPVGILDEALQHKHVKIHGVPVLGIKADLPALIRQKGITDVVVTTPSPPVLKDVLDLCKGLDVELKTIPGVQELMNGKIKLEAVREIRIEDLLGREPVITNLNSIRYNLYGKTILVTGAGGSIGSELCRQIATFRPSNLILLGHGENSIYEILLELVNKGLCPVTPVVADIRDTEELKRILARFKPEVLFHAAAHKHVPFMEMQPFEAVRNNFLATCALAKICCSTGVKRFVFLSSDKSVQPSSVMGVTKRLCEIFLQALQHESPACGNTTQFISVRFGNVMNSRGSVIPTFRKQIALGGPVTVTHPDMTRYFMTIPEAVQLVLQAAALGNGGEIFLLDMGRPVNILDLANQMIRLAGYEPGKDIEIKVTGTRPGEKLYEKLLADDETSGPTTCDKILLIRSAAKGLAEMENVVKDISELCEKQDREMLHHAIRRLVPEYAKAL